MKVDAIKITDYMKTGNEMSNMETNSSVDINEDKKDVGELKALKVENAFYTKKGNYEEEQEKTKRDIEENATLGQEAMNEINNMSKNIDEDLVQKAEDDGHDLMDMDAHTIVTMADEIKLTLAKAGVDVSKLGGLDEETVEEMTGSVAQAVELTNGINDTLSDASIKYLVTNELEPTILNIYNANYSTPGQYEQEPQEVLTDDEVIDLLQKLGDKLDALINEAEMGDKDTCAKMLQQDIPLTKENLEYMTQLQNFEKPDEEEIISAISDIVTEGKAPEDAYLIEGYSLMDQARDAVEEVQSIDPESLKDVQSRITLTEVQLSMTVEATFTMMKNGVEVNTSDLADLLDKLKAQETSLLEVLMKQDGKESTKNAIDTYQETMKEMAEVKAAPAAVLGQFSNINQTTLSEVHQVSVSFTAQFTQMESTYEAVGTEVRKDLGDNIQKAFSNVDDILADLNLETSESNEKAVRILAYNNLEINEESVTTMKNAAELVNRTFKNMTPAVVTEMIKRGENPLDMKMEDLQNKTEEIKTEMGSTSDSESFSKFLWKAEHTDGVTEEERESYIGVYRLLDKVEKSDGAAIGALISQGSDITLRNLMTAVRSSKNTGKEYEVSDKTGSLEQLNVQDLSITEQVEKVFLTNRCRDAKEAMTPAKLQQVGEEIYMEMDPDEFATAMETANDDATEAAYVQNLAEQLKMAVQANQDVYSIIEEYNLPNSANMVSAIQAMLDDNNAMVKELYGKAAEQEDMDIDYLIEEVIERFGEACKTPEEMAEAEEALATLAENCMKTMINEEDVTTIDMDGMKLIIQQAKAYNTMAQESETYHIPIMVADEAGNLNLKIVRGTNENGLVKMALSMMGTGTISSTFKYENGEVNATVSCETNEMREAFAADAPIIAQTMQEETGFSYNFSFGREDGMSVNDIYKNETGIFETTDDKSDEIQTDALYGIARGFIKVIGEMFG